MKNLKFFAFYYSIYHILNVDCNLETQIENITKLFVKAHSEFKESKQSEKSVEDLYDLTYLLEGKEKTDEENYILAYTYNLLGKIIEAQKTIEKGLKREHKKVNLKLIKLQKEIDKKRQSQYIKKYRDLRDSKVLKKPTTLKNNDFIVTKDAIANYNIKLNENIPTIIILNKRLLLDNDSFIFSHSKPDDWLIMLIIEHIEWLGTTDAKEKLFSYYLNNKFEYKLEPIGEDWFHGLDVWDCHIEIDKNHTIFTSLCISDYAQNDFGFRLELKDRDIQEIEYNPIL